MLRRDRPGDAASGLKGDAALLAERGEVEVDDLAGHQPITERVPRWRRARRMHLRPQGLRASLRGSFRGAFPIRRRCRPRTPSPRPLGRGRGTLAPWYVPRRLRYVLGIRT